MARMFNNLHIGKREKKVRLEVLSVEQRCFRWNVLETIKSW